MKMYYSGIFRYVILAFFVVLFVPTFGMAANPSELEEYPTFNVSDIPAEALVAITILETFDDFSEIVYLVNDVETINATFSTVTWAANYDLTFASTDQPISEDSLGSFLACYLSGLQKENNYNSSNPTVEKNVFWSNVKISQCKNSPGSISPTVG